MLLRLWFLVLCVLAGAFASPRADARAAETHARQNEVAGQKLAPGVFESEAAILRQAAAMQAAELQQAKSGRGYDFASGCCLAPENAASRFNRVTTPWQRNVYQRADIDWDFVRPEGVPLAGRTNRFAAAQGYAPGRINPKTGKWDDVVLHHLLDDPRGAVIETWRSSHTRFHNTIGRGPNDFNEFRGTSKPWRKLHPEWEEAWNNEVHGYWSWRNGSRPNAPRRERLMLPGDEP